MTMTRTAAGNRHDPSPATKQDTAAAIELLGSPTAMVLAELRARQIELERQNEALRISQLAVETALCTSEERFHQLLENVPTVAVQGYALDGTTQYWNQASTNLYGYSADEAIGRNLLDLIIPAEMRSGVSRAMQNMAATGVAIPTGELSLMRKDGTRVDVLSSHTLVRMPGRELELFCIDIDITERKRAEAALRASEEGYRQLLQLLPEAICIHRDEIIFFANDAAVDLFGAGTASALIGLNWHRLMAPEHWSNAERRCGSLIRGEVPRLPRTEMNYIALDGRTIPAESTSSRVAVEGKPAIMTLVRDISERKRIEKELKDYRTELEDQVQKRTADLSAALHEAKLADQAKDAFLANVSHELRTPLTAVLGLSALALSHGEDPKQRDYLQKIGKAGKHLSRIINDLLDLSKIVAGRLEFEAITFSLRGMMQHCHAVMADKAKSKGLQITQHIGDEVPDALVGDPLRLEQILLNLIGNAIKFTRAGRIDVRVVLSARREHGVCLHIDVEDTGIGMQPEDIAGLFQPFSQADASMSRKYGGTGLGLAISRRLAELMDGDISVTSREGSGTTFSVKVWLKPGDARNLPNDDANIRQQPVVHHYRDARVLIAEDHPMNMEIVSELLNAVGITPRTANNGQEALDILAAFGPTAFDLVLMDIQMPIMDGLTATRELRTWTGFSQLPVVAMTAHAMEHEKETRATAGMNDHIIKPFDTESFYRVLARWMPDSKKLEPGNSALPANPSATGLQALYSIDSQAAMARFSGNEARYRHWLAMFVEESPATVAQLRQALAAGETEKAGRAVHAFKGRVGMLGITSLHARATGLETALQNTLPTDDLLDEMECAIEQTRAEIKAALGM